MTATLLSNLLLSNPSFNAHSLGASSMFSHKSCTSSGFKPFSSGDDSYTSYFCKAGSVTTPVLRFSFGKDNTGDLSTIAVFLSIAVQDFGRLFSGIDRRKRSRLKVMHGLVKAVLLVTNCFLIQPHPQIWDPILLAMK
ncbi:hypothetical protein Tco_1047852, partial [Tanacetum coccineum]